MLNPPGVSKTFLSLRLKNLEEIFLLMKFSLHIKFFVSHAEIFISFRSLLGDFFEIIENTKSNDKTTEKYFTTSELRHLSYKSIGKS